MDVVCLFCLFVFAKKVSYFSVSRKILSAHNIYDVRVYVFLFYFIFYFK